MALADDVSAMHHGDAVGRLAPVYVPYVADRLAPSTRAAVDASGLSATYVDTSEHDGYYRLLRDLWGQGTDFILVEQDVVPDPEALRSIAACESDACGSPYPVGNIWGSFLGCARFGAALMRRYPMAVLSFRVTDWDSLDGQLLSYINRREADPVHWHWPAADHLNPAYDHDRVFANCGPCGGPLRFKDLRFGPEVSKCPQCGIPPAYFPDPRPRPNIRVRSAMLTKLIYTGSGHYLNGVPARDFETDDAALIKECVASGLYIRIEPKKAPSGGAAAVQPSAPAPSPAPKPAPPAEPNPVAPSAGDTEPAPVTGDIPA